MQNLKRAKKIPTFRTEEDERDFWSKTDSTGLIDWSKAKRVRLPALKASTQTISLRLPQDLLDEIKILANDRDVPYQSLIKVFLHERIRRERGSS